MPKRIVTFEKSFRPEVNLKPNNRCSLKKHYRGVLREIVGFLDNLADKNSERFVWATVPAIVRACTKFSRGREPYKKRMVYYGLRFLQEQGVLQRAERIQAGIKRLGFIVMRHDEIAGSIGVNLCKFASRIREIAA